MRGVVRKMIYIEGMKVRIRIEREKRQGIMPRERMRVAGSRRDRIVALKMDTYRDGSPCPVRIRSAAPNRHPSLAAYRHRPPRALANAPQCAAALPLPRANAARLFYFRARRDAPYPPPVPCSPLPKAQKAFQRATRRLQPGGQSYHGILKLYGDGIFC